MSLKEMRELLMSRFHVQRARTKITGCIDTSDPHDEVADKYCELAEMERELYVTLRSMVIDHPMWEKFFHEIDGIGPFHAATMLTEFPGPEDTSASGYISHAGLDMPDRGKGYRQGMPDPAYNVFLRRILLYNTPLIRAQGYYRDKYDTYRDDLREDMDDEGKIHREARRRMVKELVVDYHAARSASREVMPTEQD